MDQALKDLGDYVADNLPDAVESVETGYGELMVRVGRDGLIGALTFLRDDQNCQFKQVADVTAVDFPARAEARTGNSVADGYSAAAAPASEACSPSAHLEKRTWMP